MAKGVTVQVDGIDKIIKKIGSIPDAVAMEVDAEMDDVCRQFVNRAAEQAPVDTGLLKNRITYSGSHMKYEIVADTKYAAYVEFGTITKVRVPTDLTSYAAQFKGKGVKKHGGMRARPYFFPQMAVAQTQLNQALKAIAKRLFK